MKIDKMKLYIALARECKTLSDLRHVIHPSTLAKIRNDPDYQPSTKIVGNLAKALNVDPADLIMEG